MSKYCTALAQDAPIPYISMPLSHDATLTLQ
jgi:hypothetical protein